MNRSAGGFTLLEVVAVLTLMALLAAVSLPALFRGTGGVDVRLCRDQVFRDLRAARAEAVGTMRRTAVVLAGGRYTLDFGDGAPMERTLPAGFSLGLEGGGEGEEERVAFSPDGASTGARLALRAASGRIFRLCVGEDGSLAWE